VGKDAFGEQLRAAAAGDGVAVHYLEDPETPTGTCAVLVKDHERSLVANVSAANCYALEHLHSEPIQKVVAATKVIYSAGFFLTVSPESMVELGKHCMEANKVFCMNLSAPFLPAVFKDQMHTVLPYCDIVFGNESESAAYADANGLEGATIQDVALSIAKLPKASATRARTVVLTQGPGNTIVCEGGKITEFAVPAIPDSEMVDVNGAGDAFVGGFLVMYMRGASTEECCRVGNYAAGKIIRTSGCVLSGTPDF